MLTKAINRSETLIIKLSNNEKNILHIIPTHSAVGWM